MTPLAFAVTLISFVGALLSLSALLWGLRSRTRAGRLELKRRVGPIPVDGGVLRAVSAPEAQGLTGAPVAWLSLQLRNAGDPHTVGRLAVTMLLSAMAGALVTGVLLSGPGRAAGLLLGVLPVLVLRSRARRRHDLIIAQLPDALDLVARSLRAGHALSDAFRTAAGEIRAPLGEELVTLTEQHRIGQPLRVCLDQLIERNPMVFDLRLLASAVMLQRETGANLIEILEHLAGTLRERQVFTHKLSALTAEVRVSAAILGALPFVVAGVLLLLRPSYLKPLVTAPLGQGLLWTGIVLMGSGLLLMRTLSRVEV